MAKEENSYKSIMKGVSAFGGVKLFEVLMGIVRGKFVAMFLGPGGMGISGLFASAIAPVQQFSSLGLNLAIVKEVASSKEDPKALGAVFATARRMITFTALLGALVCMVAAPWLSRSAFGSDAYTWQFMLLSLSVFLGVGGAGRLSMLQGLHEVKRLSKASIVGGLTGLFVGVPLYWLFSDKGIVPAMIALNLSMFVFYSVSLRRCRDKTDRVRFVWQEHSPLVRRLIAVGFVLMASDLIGSICTYGTNSFIRLISGVTAVGLFGAANSLTNQYAGMVFTAMSLDYFPRLTAVASDNRRMAEVVNRQTEIVAFLIAPIAILLILTAPWVIRILLTERFLPALQLMRWLGVGVMLRALMFPMGYIAFAKDNRRLFFWLEGVYGNLLTLVASCSMFWLFGLNGIGIGVVVDGVICFTTYYIVNHRCYGYRISGMAARGCVYAALTTVGAFAASFISDQLYSTAAMGVVFLLSAFYSVRMLRLRWKESRKR